MIGYEFLYRVVVHFSSLVPKTNAMRREILEKWNGTVDERFENNLKISIDLVCFTQKHPTLLILLPSDWEKEIKKKKIKKSFV